MHISRQERVFVSAGHDSFLRKSVFLVQSLLPFFESVYFKKTWPSKCRQSSNLYYRLWKSVHLGFSSGLQIYFVRIGLKCGAIDNRGKKYPKWPYWCDLRMGWGKLWNAKFYRDQHYFILCWMSSAKWDCVLNMYSSLPVHTKFIKYILNLLDLKWRSKSASLCTKWIKKRGEGLQIASISIGDLAVDVGTCTVVERKIVSSFSAQYIVFAEQQSTKILCCTATVWNTLARAVGTAVNSTILHKHFWKIHF